MVKAIYEKGIKQTLCRMCDDHCGTNVYFEDGYIKDIDGLANHPWNKGRLCLKGRAAKDMVYSPERLMKPLKRDGDKWVEISFDQALDEIAEKIKKIKAEDGDRNLGIWKGEGIGFNQQEGYARRFAYAVGTPNYFSNNTQCSKSRKMAYTLVRGHYPVEDLENAKCIIVWGVNPPYSQAQITRMIMDAKDKGAKIIVVDPRLCAMARSADLYVPIKPATDGALALGIINIIIKNKWYDQEFVNKYTVGFEKLADYATKFTPSYVEKETGIAEKTLFQIAEIFAKCAPKSTILTGNGLEHCQNGVNNVRAIASMGALCGCIDQLGGDIIGEGINLNNLIPDWKKLKDKEPIGSKEYPVFYEFAENHTITAMDAILTGKPYPIKGMIITAANPALTNANSGKVIKALSQLDLLVVRDLFMTETAQLAHYVLPAASFLERSEIVVNKRFNTITKTTKMLEFEEWVDEYTFWHQLSLRLGLEEYFPWQNEEEVNKWLLEPTDITVEDLKDKPLGIKYKPIQYLKYQGQEKPFDTPSGKVEFASNYLKELGYSELPEYISPFYLDQGNKDYPFVLISGARNMFFNHGRYHNIPRFQTANPFPEIEINAEDAEQLGVIEGEMVYVSSELDSIEIKVKIVHPCEIVKGAVQITHGWVEANVNKLTTDQYNDPISGFPMLKALPVKISKIN